MNPATLIINAERRVEQIGGKIPAILEAHVGELLGCDVRDLFQSADPIGGAALRTGLDELLTGIREEAAGSLKLDAAGTTVIIADWRLSPLTGTDRQRRLLLQLSARDREFAAAESVESYREIFHNAVVGVFRTTLGGRYLDANPALARIYGYATPAELVETLHDLNTQLYVKPGRRNEFLRLIQQQGVVEDFESEIHHAAGGTVWIAEYARIVSGTTGEPLYFEGTVLDVTAHKQAEDDLRRSRERFRRLVETVGIVPWEAELETGQLIYVGPQAEELLGFPMAVWLEPNFWNYVVHSADREWVTIARDEALEKRGHFECEYRMITATGTVRWVRDLISVIRGDDGRELLGGFFLDITHRRSAEDLLQQSQHFIEQVAAASPVIWYLYDTEIQRVKYVNGGGLRSLGYTREALMAMEPFFLLALAHPDESRARWAHFAELPLVSPGRAVERIFRLRAADGRWVCLRSHETASRTDAVGGAQEIVGIAEDITDQQANLEEIIDNEAMFRRLAEATRVVPFEYDFATARFTYVGPQAEALLGLPHAQWHGAEFWPSVIHPDDLSAADACHRRALEQMEYDVECELRLRTPTGEIRWVRQIIRVERTRADRRRGRGFLIDISAAKAIDAEREESRRQLRDLAHQHLKEREQERTAVAREIHDELGQALTLLRMELAWIGGRTVSLLPPQTSFPLVNKIAEMEEQIGATLETLRKIITTLRPPVLDEFGLGEAIEWQAREFSRRVGIRCIVQTTAFRACECKEKATAVFRVFQEILTNVMRHARASRVDVQLVQDGGTLRLMVRDNGCGFTPGQLDQRAGFGLLGMRERAEAAGGVLEIISAPGTGTEVTLMLADDPSDPPTEAH